MLERACEQGHALACSGLAKMAQDGQGANVSPERQRSLLELGCNQGDANACYRLGAMTLAADGSSASASRAHQYFARACDQADQRGCLELGLDFKTGRAGVKDLVRAASLLNAACKQNLALGCHELGDLQQAPGTALHNPAQARQNFDKACTLNHGEACHRLAVLLEAGERDLPRARALHDKACSLEQWGSCLAFGRARVKSDPEVAEAAFAKACDAGLTEGCLERAEILANTPPETGAPRELALELFLRACEAKLAPACARAAELELQLATGPSLTREARDRLTNLLTQGCDRERQDSSCLTLGGWLATGAHATPKDGKSAAALLGPLCAKTNSKGADAPLERSAYGSACHHLAHLHERGIGVEKSALGAASLYDKACEAGYESSCLAQALLSWRGMGNTQRNAQLAVSRFRALCDNDETAQNLRTEACVYLGYAELTGTGTPQNSSSAKARFEPYCTRGDQQACAYLGHYLVTTRGTEQDRKQGESLLRSACDRANGRGCFFLADLPHLPKKQRTELLERACLLDVPEACN
jgi:TPR repeat protein